MLSRLPMCAMCLRVLWLPSPFNDCANAHSSPARQMVAAPAHPEHERRLCSGRQEVARAPGKARAPLALSSEGAPLCIGPPLELLVNVWVLPGAKLPPVHVLVLDVDLGQRQVQVLAVELPERHLVQTQLT